MSRISWADKAACLGIDAAIFFPLTGQSARPARKICKDCSVRVDCLEYALENGEKYGIWGGTDPRERRRIRRQRANEPQGQRRPQAEHLVAVARPTVQ